LWGAGNYFVTTAPTIRLARGAMNVTEGKATTQEANQDPIQTLKTWGSKPTALNVATPEIIKDMMADKIKLNNMCAYFLGIIMVSMKVLM
jgi:hypothetical protein